MKPARENIFIRMTRIRVLQHLLFWLISFITLVFLMRVSADVKLIDIVYVLIFHIVIVPPVYLNLHLLVPKLMAQRNYGFYLIAFLSNVALGAGFYYLVFDVVVDWVLPGYYFVAIYEIWEIALILLAYLIITLLIKLAKAWFLVKEMERESTRHQLEALKSQVNPHFLFNTLSSIYSLARKNSEMAPFVILQLSDVMRYMLYDTNSERIELMKELEVINSILEIHKIRFGEKLLIEKRICGEIDNIKIAPMVLIPFIENVMKHCRPTPDGKFFIRIEINTDGRRVQFLVENSFNTASSSEKGGIGIENVSKRLNLIYTGKHQLRTWSEGNVFYVELDINLD